jgi:hypothetical protein
VRALVRRFASVLGMQKGEEEKLRGRGFPSVGCFSSSPLYVYVRRCPTLPHRLRCSTIGAGGLNFRVRNGTGCFPTAMTTETLNRTRWAGWFVFPVVFREPHSEREHRSCSRDPPCWVGVFKSLGLLVPVDSTPCGASISGLSTQSSSWGPYNHEGLGDLIWRKASRLDAFSGYPDRT